MKLQRIKKLFSLAVISAAIFLSAAAGSAEGVDYHSMPSETKYSNVALYKPVATSDGFAVEQYGYPMFSLEKINDSNYKTCTLGTIPAEGWIQVDLLKRYKVKEIVLTDRYDVDQGGVRTNVQILGSNDESFTEYDVLDSIGASASDKFAYQGKWKIMLDGKKDYRYIRIKHNTGAYGGFGELQVYADFQITEVSRNKPATANGWYDDGTVSTPPSMALDDVETNMNGWFAFIDVLGRQYNYMQVDLETPMNIGFIKMTPRPDDPGGLNFYQAFDFYGSADPIDTEEEKLYVTAPEAEYGMRYLTEADGYTTLARVSTADTYISGFSSEDFPMTDTKPFEQAVNDTIAFQYITYKHTYQLNTEVGTISLYVINPEVHNIETDGVDFKIDFSDKMDFTDAAGIIEIADKNGKTYTIESIAYDDYSISFKAALPLGEVFTLNIKKEAENAYGIPMTADVKKSFETPPAIEISDFRFTDYNDESNTKIDEIGSIKKLGAAVDISNNTTDKKEYAVLFVLLYDENNVLVSSSQKKIEASPETVGVTYKIGIDIPEGETGFKARAFLWKNFKTMQSWTDMIKIE